MSICLFHLSECDALQLCHKHLKLNVRVGADRYCTAVKFPEITAVAKLGRYQMRWSVRPLG